MLSSISLEALPVITFFRASDVNGKCGPPEMNSPNRKKGMTRLGKKIMKKIRALTALQQSAQNVVSS